MCSNAFEKRVTKVLPFILSGEIELIDNKEINFEYSEIEHMTFFFKKNSFDRKFHTLFDWDSSKLNVNKFLDMFGKDFRVKIRGVIDKDQSMIDGEKAFMVLGRNRNLLVHNGIYEQNLPTEMDLDIIYKSYVSALDFCSKLFSIIYTMINEDRK